MREWIRIDKRLALKLSCYTYQGYRSVHRALQEGFWPAFRAYYTPEKRRVIRGLIDELVELTPSHLRRIPPPRTEDLAQITPAVSRPFRFLFGKLFGKRKQSWCLDVREARFISARLERFLDYLERPIAPPMADLWQLQVDVCNCSGIIDTRCFGMPELKRARYIEHFDYTEWAPHFQLWEILGEPAPASATSGPAKAAG